MRGEKPVDGIEHCGRRIEVRIERPEEVRGGPNAQQDERNGREDDVERDASGEEQDVVLAAVVPDALDVVAEDPSETDVERPLVHRRTAVTLTLADLLLLGERTRSRGRPASAAHLTSFAD